MSQACFMPIATTEIGLYRYLQEIRKFPILTEEEEYNLADLWRRDNDLKSAHTLVTSHLRLVAKLAMRYRGYGLPIMDLIAEGNIGLMHAVKKFIPELGHRLSTYAMWWVKAYIQDYVLKSWSMVKISCTAAQKRLFFNLRKIKNKLLSLHGKSDINDNIKEIAEQLNVSEQDVINMDNKLIGHENSLNDTIGEEGAERIDFIADPSPTPEMIALENSEHNYKKRKLDQGLKTLTLREQDILKCRALQQPASTLEDLSQKFKISRERVRQIEHRAMQKLQHYCTSA